jgi:hypothetical protein
MILSAYSKNVQMTLRPGGGGGRRRRRPCGLFPELSFECYEAQLTSVGGTRQQYPLKLT